MENFNDIVRRRLRRLSSPVERECYLRFLVIHMSMLMDRDEQRREALINTDSSFHRGGVSQYDFH